MIKVAIVDDHPAVRHAWMLFLSTDQTLTIVGVFSSGNEMIEKLTEVNPDVILMDISMPGMSGIEATKRIMVINVDVKIIAVTTHSSSVYKKEILDAGAKGFVSKYSVSEQLLQAIKEVYKGNTYIGEDL
ncbi:MAG: response regulator transcription factor [Chitinophagaceae bacterium]|nr:response regulator transcription factor [Chitinophagaceae bacterium]